MGYDLEVRFLWLGNIIVKLPHKDFSEDGTTVSRNFYFFIATASYFSFYTETIFDVLSIGHMGRTRRVCK